MKVFLDVDALHKLAAFNLFDEVLQLLSTQRAEVWILPTAKFQLRLKPPEAAIKRHGPEAAARLLSFVPTVNETPNAPSVEDVELIGNVPWARRWRAHSHRSGGPRRKQCARYRGQEGAARARI